MDENSWNWLEMVGKGQNWPEIAENSRKGWKFLEMTGNGQNWLNMAGNGRNGWKFLGIDRNDHDDAGESNGIALLQF